MADQLLAYRDRFPTLRRGPYFAAHTLGPMPDTVPAALTRFAAEWADDGVVAWHGWLDQVRATAALLEGLLGAACALVLRAPLAGVVALLAYGLGELVLAPRWASAGGWTLYAAAARLAGQGTAPVGRAVLVVALAVVVALAGCLALYARRQVRD